jgi:hypothetical protein
MVDGHRGVVGVSVLGHVEEANNLVIEIALILHHPMVAGTAMVTLESLDFAIQNSAQVNIFYL